jgi:hypothetical protein
MVQVNNNNMRVSTFRTHRGRGLRQPQCGPFRLSLSVWDLDALLELNRRRVNNPTLRVSTNQIVGVVEITQEGNPDLRDRTGREGFINRPASGT